MHVGPFIFDPGTTSIAPRGKALEPVMLGQLDTSDLAKILKQIYTHNALRVMPGDPSHMRTDRYCYHSGNEILPFLLASGLEVPRERPSSMSRNSRKVMNWRTRSLMR